LKQAGNYCQGRVVLSTGFSDSPTAKKVATGNMTAVEASPLQQNPKEDCTVSAINEDNAPPPLKKELHIAPMLGKYGTEHLPIFPFVF
jgi:hypothetical protein